MRAVIQRVTHAEVTVNGENVGSIGKGPMVLLGDARGQNRPGFTQAEAPERANALYQLVCERIRAQDVPVATGVFRADMQIELCNDGPVTILLDSEKTF